MRILILLILVAYCIATINANSSDKRDHQIQNSCDDDNKNAKGNDKLNKDDNKNENKGNDDKKKDDDKVKDDKRKDVDKVKDDKRKDNDIEVVDKGNDNDKKKDEKNNDDKKNGDKKKDDGEKNDDKKKDNDKVKDDRKKDDDKKNVDKKCDDDKKKDDRKKDNDKIKDFKKSDGDKVKDEKKKDDDKEKDGKRNDDDKKNNDGKKKGDKITDNDNHKRCDNHGKNKHGDKKKHDDKNKHDHECTPDTGEEQPNCPQVCPFYVITFCALPDGWCGEPRSFGNPCFLELYNCKNPKNKYKYFHDGECLTTPAPEPECGIIDCPFDYTPFCALALRFCGQPRTFSNKCELEVYNCFNPTQQYEYFHDGECLTTPVPEPDCSTLDSCNDQKICGLPEDFCGKPRTFSDLCDLEVYNTFNPSEQYEYFHDGECLPTPVPEPDCSTLDSCNDQKICGLPEGFCGNPKTFSDLCDLEVYNTFNPSEQYVYFHDGECLTTPVAEPDCSTLDSCNDQKICGLPEDFCGKPRTFSDLCDLEVYNTFNPSEQYEYFHDGECLTTPVPEPDCSTLDSCNDQKICGLPEGFCGNPKTFSDLCDLEVYNTFNPSEQYIYFHDGECLTTPVPEPDCSTLDSCNDQKICGLPEGFCGNPKTFSDLCDLEVYNTFNPSEQYIYFHDGECLTTPVPEPDCSTLDSCNDQKICGLPEGFCGNPKTFSDLCDLEVYNTFNPSKQYVYFHDGECLTTPVPEPDCSTLDSCGDQKICGLPEGFCGNPKTFSDLCDLEVYNTFNPSEQYEYFHDGECLTTPVPEPDCSTLDSCDDEPICGLPVHVCGKPKTFSNTCDLQVYNNFNPNEKYKFFHNGECLDTTLPEPEPECNIICLDSYNPICTLPDDICGKPKTFANECSLNAYNCKNKNQKFKKFHDGQCLTDNTEPECNRICPAIHMPVCTIPDGFCGEPKTYSSSCVLASENCLYPNRKYKYFHDGECLPKPSVCPTVCTDEYEPICATGQSGDLRRFSNKCELDMYNCLNADKQYTFAYDGECKECSDLMCNKIGMPVCGTNYNNELRTFGNLCELQRLNCENPDDQYEYSYDGACMENPIICTKEYMPVCAFSCTLGSKTFSNKCEQQNYITQHPDEGYSYAYNGNCTSSCKLGCPRIYAPVCGRDCSGNIKTFSNQCVFESHNCEQPTMSYAILYDGECNQCNEICPENYDPFCAIDSLGNELTFGNQCELDRYNCQNPNNQYTKSYNGACNQCITMCTENYDPFCAADAFGNERTFGNQCELNSYNCQNPNNQYTKVYNGECNQCNTMCTENYQPFCAADADGNEKTFGNQCDLDSYNCQNPKNQFSKLYDGKCKLKCLKPCPKILAPVCGKDLNGNTKTFNNQCEMSNYNCENPDNEYTLAYSGRCKPACNTMCTYEYNPVCGINSKGKTQTFGNKCSYESHICNYPEEGFSLLSEGECT